MQALEKVFEYQGQPVRTVTKDGEAWFVAKDVCECLEIDNARDAIQRLDEDEVDSTDVIDSLGRKQTVNIVNEPGLYNLVLGSRKPEAKQFKRWVTHEVLPTIRQTGVYAAPEMGLETLALGQQRLVEMQQEIVKIMSGFDERLRQLESREAGEPESSVVQAAFRQGNRRHFKVERMGCIELVNELMRQHKVFDEIAVEVEKATGKRIGKSSLGRYWQWFKEHGDRTEVTLPSGVKVVEEKRWL